MKLFIDQDVYAATVNFLVGAGHDVVTAAQHGFSQALDSELLKTARAEQRIFVTRDRDFGGIVFVQALGPGVIYLRALPTTLNSVHAELERVMKLYSESELLVSFVVVEPGRHRIRRPATNKGP